MIRLIVVLSWLVNFGSSFPNLNSLKVDDNQLYKASLKPKGRSIEKVEELYFPQTVDHFSKTIQSKFQQRYYRLDAYYKVGGPALLYLGGEGELNSLWGSKTILTSVAKAKNGVVYALEHRYYGKSVPFNTTSVENLKYLNSLQALYDIKNFIQKVALPKRNQKAKEVGKTSWVVVGGSYPGNLAAWTKLKFGGLVKGAIASSAPVQAQVDFYQFDQQIQMAIEAKGGKKCLQYYLQLFQQIDTILLGTDKSLATQLKRKFGCADVDDRDFVKSLDIFSSLAQYDNYPNASNSIQNHCKSLDLKVSVDQAMDNFAKSYKSKLAGFTCKQTTDFSGLKDLKPDKENAARLWLYQCCNEFGYWQTAPPTTSSKKGSLRSKLLDVPYHQKTFCDNLFFNGFQPNVNYTNFNYQGNQIQTNNLVFTNGQYDPWLSLSVLPNHQLNQLGMASYIIPNASHVSDLIEPLKDDTKEVLDAKKRNIEILSGWL